MVQPWMIIKLQKTSRRLCKAAYLALCLQPAAKTGAFLDLNMSASLTGAEPTPGLGGARAFCEVTGGGGGGFSHTACFLHSLEEKRRIGRREGRPSVIST